MRVALLQEFSWIRGSSIIGTGDREMTRDQHTAFPGAVGGYADWYIGTTRQLATQTIISNNLTPVQFFSDGSIIYKTEINNEDIPCLYTVTEVTDAEVREDGTRIACELIKQDRFIKQATDTNSPRIFTNEEGAFTVYQSTDVYYRAEKPVESVSITGLTMPDIEQIQAWVLRGEVAPLGLDVLVKGAIPTTVRISCKIHLPATERTDTDWLRTILANYVNELPFDGLLTTSHITALLHQYLPAGSFISDPVIFARTYLPDGRIALSQSTDKLVINFPPYATNRTTLFYCDPSDVTFSDVADTADSKFAKTYAAVS
jgi:hypothetical protein